MPGLGFSPQAAASRGRRNQRPLTKALLARMASAQTASRQRLIDDAIRILEASGTAAQVDFLHLEAAADAQAARLNWLAPIYDLTAVGAPVFTADRHYAGDGATSRLDTGFDPVAAVGKMSTNSASLGIWMPGTAVNGGYPFGNLNATIRPREGISSFSARLNNSVTTSISDRSPVAGFYLLNRTNGAGYDVWVNGEKVYTQVAASSAMSAQVMQILGRQTSNGVFQYNAGPVAASWAGGGLTDVQCVALYAALSGYLAGIGAA